MKTRLAISLISVVVSVVISGLALAKPAVKTMGEAPVARIRITYGDKKSQFVVTKNKGGTGTLKATVDEGDESTRTLSADDIAFLIESLNQVEGPRKGERICERANIKADYISHGKPETRSTCLLKKVGVRQRLVQIADLLATHMATRRPATKAK